MAKKIGVILNMSARTASKLDSNEVQKTIKRQLPKAKLYIIKSSFTSAVNRAVRDGCTVLCAGGGDGTVSGVATACVKHNLVLGVIPLGTMNNFSKDLGIPQDLAEACKIVKQNKVKKVDYATVNNDLFINNSSLGVYTKYVRQRESHQKVLGKIPAYLTSLISTIANFSILDVTLKYDGKAHSFKTPMIFVSNNDYGIDQKLTVRRKTLNSGKLAVNILIHGGLRGIIDSIKGLFKPKKFATRYKSFHTEELTINATNTKIAVAKDGEIITTKLPLVYKIHKNRLSVIVL